MAYDEYLADRIKHALELRKISFEEKKMMGGLCFMVQDKMCIGITKSNLMARIDPEIYDEALRKTGSRPMDFTGRPMKGFIFVEPEGYDMDDDLDYWVNLCLEYNPKAKSSKKKK
ncbi:MAG: TfoX/Sxy family protein [Candidatus Cyclobacteriaceae bacterium M2_1C_046]